MTGLLFSNSFDQCPIGVRDDIVQLPETRDVGIDPSVVIGEVSGDKVIPGIDVFDVASHLSVPLATCLLGVGTDLGIKRFVHRDCEPLGSE